MESGHICKRTGYDMWSVAFFVLALVAFCRGMGAEQPEQVVYTLNFNSEVYVCPDEESKSMIDTSGLSVVRHNETTAYLTGSIEFLKDFVDQIVVEIVLYKEKAGRLEVAITETICDLCDEIKPTDEENLYKKILKYIDFPSECPIVKGEYKVDNLVVDTDELPIDAPNEGSYCGKFNFYTSRDPSCKDKTFLGCVQVDLMIEPM